MMTLVYALEIGIIIFLNVYKLKGEVFTSIMEVKALLYTQENVHKNLKQYVFEEDRRLNIIKRYLKIFTVEDEKASKDAQAYVNNPINAFTLIKRLSNDFKHIKIVASEPTEYAWERQLQYPSEEDLVGAAVAIARLQRTYKLNANDLAEGKLMATFSHEHEVIPFMHSPMTAKDCYSLSRLLYITKQFYYAAEWFETAQDKLNNDKMVQNALRELKTYSVSHSSSFKPVTTKRRLKRKVYDDEEESINWNQYGQLCRGEINISSSNASKLRCSYLKNNPFLRLAPIKMEELRKDPGVFLFHDVLTDSEIEIMKQIASPKLKRAEVIIDGVKVPMEGRIGKNARLDEYNDTIETVRQRAADFTGLSMAHAEPLQVLNYGIGGHYDNHYDAFDDPAVYGDLGNRIATVLFYMSDVSQGGATVFPRLQIAVKPKKGAALYWLNLDLTGKIDRRTLHAACSVLYGYKWVSNIWIHEAGQELSRPCPVV